MGYEVTDAIADLIFQAEPDLASRLTAQDEVLRKTLCTTPELGRWFDTYDAAYLLSVIALGDEAFVEEFAPMAQVGAATRRHLLVALAAHPDECPHCALKRDYDLEMGGRVERVCQQNSNYLLCLLREEETE